MKGIEVQVRREGVTVETVNRPYLKRQNSVCYMGRLWDVRTESIFGVGVRFIEVGPLPPPVKPSRTPISPLLATCMILGEIGCGNRIP